MPLGRAFAEEGETPRPPRPEKRGDRRPGQEKAFRKIAKELGLSEEQMQKIREFKMEEARKMKEFRQEQESKISELLTEEQRAKYKELQSKRRKKMGREGQRRDGQGRGGRDGGGGRKNDPLEMLRRISKELGLSEEQQGKIKELGKQSRMEMLKIIEQARATGDFAGVRKQVEKLQKSLIAKAREMLTEEQKTKFDAFLKDGREGLRRMLNPNAGRRKRSPEEMMRYRLKEIQKALELLPEEAMIIMPKIEEIVKTQGGKVSAYRDQRRQVEALLKSPDVDEESIDRELALLRKLREEEKNKIEKLQEGLRELLTLKQEAKLVLAGILR
jgi:Spy/CpxP family protein refolding chaperone